MARSTRSFRLTLSQAGMDLLIDAHCHLIRATRRLLSWGATLHIAVCYLDTLPSERISKSLAALPQSGLIGSDLHHLGAPARLADVAASISRRAGGAAGLPPPTRLGDIYIAALREAAQAPADVLCKVQSTMIEQGLCNVKFRQEDH
jgi:hypothetical protein